MTVTCSETIGCEETKSPVEASANERIPLTALPKLAWAGAGLFLANLVIGFGMMVTPNIDVDPYGREVQSVDSASKMSPFTEVVDTEKHKVRLAAKATPVTFTPAPLEEDPSAYTAASLDMSRGSAVQQLHLPGASRAYQQLDLPVRTERALYQGAGAYQGVSADVAPRRASERPKSDVVIN